MAVRLLQAAFGWEYAHLRRFLTSDPPAPYREDTMEAVADPSHPEPQRTRLMGGRYDRFRLARAPAFPDIPALNPGTGRGVLTLLPGPALFRFGGLSRR